MLFKKEKFYVNKIVVDFNCGILKNVKIEMNPEK